MKTGKSGSYELSRTASISRLGLWTAIGLAGMVFCRLDAGAAGYSFTKLASLGDSAFAFPLRAFSFPVGVISGLYRYAHDSRTVTAAVAPNCTAARAGGTFAGVFFGTALNNAGDLLFSGIIATPQGIHIPGQKYI